jgi:hypothetical protein
VVAELIVGRDDPGLGGGRGVQEEGSQADVQETGSFGESNEGTQAGVNAVGKEGASAKA